MTNLNKINSWITASEELVIYVFFLIIVTIIGIMGYIHLKMYFMSSRLKKLWFILASYNLNFFLFGYFRFFCRLVDIDLYICDTTGYYNNGFVVFRKVPQEISVHIAALHFYKYSFVYLFFLLLANNNLSGVPVIENVLQTLIFVIVLAVTLDEITNINERYLMYVFYMLTIMSGMAITINYKAISFVVLLIFWLLPQVKIKTKMNSEEKK